MSLKRISIWMAVAVALLAALVVAPAAALESPGAANDTAFIQTPAAGPGTETAGMMGTMSTGTPGITVNKGSVIRGNNLLVTVTGEPSKEYHLFIREVDGPGEYPVITPGQVGVVSTYSPANVTILTTAAGTRTIQFNTNRSIDAQTFTICVEDPVDPTAYDDIEVEVKRGAVTVTASGTGTYYLGEEITLSGTNSDSYTTYLFLTGPNLPVNGVRLDGGMSPVENNNATSFTSTSVEADDTWSYKWDTSSITRRLDSGGYTIYAVAEPQGKNNLTGTKYDTQTIQLRPGSLSVQASGTTLAKGDEYRIGGIATGNPSSVNVWIFGKNYYGGANGALAVRSVAVESDGTFECILTGAETGALQDGRYYVVVQHPAGSEFEVGAIGDSIYRRDSGGNFNVFVARLTNLQPAEAASALISALESPNVDDIYIKFSFTVGDASWIWIDGVSDQTYGETFTVTGRTGYPADTVLDFWIATEDDNTFVLSGEAVVADGGDWSIDLDTTAIGSGGFILRITAPDGQASASAIFDVYDDVTHPLPPGGGSYRVERMGTTPSLDSLSSGEGVALDGIIRLDGTFGYPYQSPRASRILEFSTDLQSPAWSYNLKVDGNLLYTAPLAVNARSFTLSGWDLDYQGGVRILLSLSGAVPQGTENPALLRILERDPDGRVVPNSEHLLSIPLTDDPAPAITDNLTLAPGWNFISIPRPLAAGNDTAAIFAGVENDRHSAFRYDTASGTWMNLTKTDRLAPLEGYWIYSTGPATIPLNFSIDPLVSPPERTLSTGWNAVGITGNTPATARDAFYSVKEQWTTLIGFNAQTQAFETGIVNSGTGANADTRPVYPGRGYWLSMTGPGTLYAIGA
ncbi:hypothetical protein [Methanoculleus sp. UBA430]|uniref:hypothetical protein n=1 Tax=Methanoculleus sp. UBA430 TaxID=1915511 RepID=UPI0025D93B10|nr:hypothetical protein [Methanoculleus sp. UBA430]